MKEKSKCSDKKSLKKYFYISQNFLSVEGEAFNEAHPAKERQGILVSFRRLGYKLLLCYVHHSVIVEFRHITHGLWDSDVIC